MLRDDFKAALLEFLANFADDPGISDEEIVDELEAHAAQIRRDIWQREGDPYARALARVRQAPGEDEGAD